MLPTILDIASLRAAFASGSLDPVGLAEIVADRISRKNTESGMPS